MKKNILALFALCSLLTSCDAFEKKEIHKEISIEKKKINDSIIRATITTSFKTGEKVKEEIQILEGSAADIDAQLVIYKKEIFELEGEDNLTSQPSGAGAAGARISSAEVKE